jgi:hypothetical protein
MVKKILPACLIALSCTLSFAQKKTVPGLYISLQGDTVKGMFYNYMQWNKNPSEVEFTIAASAKSITLTPHNCQKLILEGYDEYLSYAGKRLINPITDYDVLDKHYSSFNDEMEEVVAFLRLVTRTPNCELYVLTDSKRINFFYMLPGSSPVELKYKKNYYVENVVDADIHEYEQSNIITTTEYKNQLNNLFPVIIEKRKLTGTLEKLLYTEDDLKKFFEQLFVGERVKHKQKNPQAGWIVSAGASLNFVTVKSAKSLNGVAKEYTSSISPLLSIGYIAPVDRNFGKYFLYPQLNLFRYKNTGEINDGTFRKITTQQVDLVVSGELNGGINVVNQQNIRLYLSGGAGMMALFNNRRTDVKYLNILSSVEPYRSEQTKIALKPTPVINASAGIVVKNKFVVAVTYLLPTAIDDAFNYTPQYSGFQLRIGYKVK